jgi:two-component system response regulator YesN
MYRIYWVDVDRAFLSALLQAHPLEEMGFRLIGCSSDPLHARREILHLQPDVVFTEVEMPGLSGLDLIRTVRERRPEIVFVVVSGAQRFSYVQRALRLRVYDYCLKPVEEEHFQNLLRQLYRYLSRNQHMAAAHREALVGETENVHFNELRRYVDANFCRPMTLTELSKAFFLSTNYCGYLFKRYTGTTFVQYVRRLRLERAKLLLETTTLPIAQIATSVGYLDLSRFSRLFKAEIGLSPGQYRTQVCGEKQRR